MTRQQKTTAGRWITISTVIAVGIINVYIALVFKNDIQNRLHEINNKIDEVDVKLSNENNEIATKLDDLRNEQEMIQEIIGYNNEYLYDDDYCYYGED